MNLPITLDALQVLDAIEKRGTFAGAAALLHRVPSAITYTVNKLEQDLGLVLFVREGRKSVLTPAGRLVLEQGREILEASQRLADSARELDSGWESALNIAVDASLGVDHIFALLGDFFAIKPDIEINLYEEVLGGGWEALQDRRADLAIGLPGRPLTDKNIQAQVYCELPWVFAVAAEHELAQTDGPIPRELIESHRAVVARDSARHTAAVSYRLLSRQPMLRVPTVRDKMVAQKAGLGVGFLPVHLIENELASGELVAIQVAGVENNTVLYMAWHRGRHGKALRWFIERLKRLSAQPPATTS